MTQINKDMFYKLNKTLLINSIICFITAIFIVPFGYFSVSLFLKYLQKEDIASLQSFALTTTLLIFDSLFYACFEILNLIKVYKNKEYFSKLIFTLVHLNLIFTFISNFILIIFLFKNIFKDFKFNNKKKNKL